MEIDEKYMRRAIELARKGQFYAAPNPMVGAVIVDSKGTIIGEGYHRKCGEAHAEVNAIASVADNNQLLDSTMYVTLEPCAHTGRTGPCADLIVKTGIPRVVVGTRDPFDKVDGRGIDKLLAAGVEVAVGVLEKECQNLNARFFTVHTEHRPFIMLKWAQSADGFMDMDREPGTPGAAISSPLTRMLAHRERIRFDGILVGSGTVLADNPRLDARLWPGDSPKPIVLDRRGRVQPEHAVMQRNPLIIRDDKPLTEAMSDLYTLGITSVMVEGGATILRKFIEADLWDVARIETGAEKFGKLGRAKAPSIPAMRPISTALIDNRLINFYSNNPRVDETWL